MCAGLAACESTLPAPAECGPFARCGAPISGCAIRDAPGPSSVGGDGRSAPGDSSGDLNIDCADALAVLAEVEAHLLTDGEVFPRGDTRRHVEEQFGAIFAV